MSDKLPPRRSLESLKKEAKRWLDALRANAADARARLERTLHDAPAVPTLRDVQRALAREHGFPGWAALKAAIEALATRHADGARALAQYEAMAEALLVAYGTGTPEAMERHYSHTWHRRSWQAMRTYVQLDLAKWPESGRDPEITLDDARYLVAIEHGFVSWHELQSFTESTPAVSRLASKPVALFAPGATEDSRSVFASRDWNLIAAALRTHPSARLFAPGEMSDDVLEMLSRIETITSLNLGGSQRLTDAGLRHLSRLTQLRELDLSGTKITDRALDVLRDLPLLERINLGGTRISDDGLPNLAYCPELQHVSLQWTRTGDGAIRALAGKSKLRSFTSGGLVTDAGLAMLHELPVFKTWHGGEQKMALLSYDSSPNNLNIRGPFTDAGMRHMRGLDGLYGLNIDASELRITAAALEPLVDLPNLGWLALDAKDDWMPYVAAMSKLRFLGAQDTTAGDDGFAALGKSQSIEYIWGRRCHNLQRRGFLALAGMPKLRGLSVSCLSVDDIGVAALPTFPALRELMPMDIPDAGYRHVGKCEQLESLVLMYCRDTSDVATEHIRGLRKLTYYYNSYTTITDRTPDLLSTVESLERVAFDACHDLTNAGITTLARLPRLRELRVSGRGVNADAASAFPARVDVRIGG